MKLDSLTPHKTSPFLLNESGVIKINKQKINSSRKSRSTVNNLFYKQ